MRKILLLICSILITGILPVMADGISVISFKLLDTDLTANTRGTQKLDQNGEKAALIKIVTPERGFLFNGGSLGIVGTEEKAGEIWLYVPPRAQKITITHEVFGVLRDYFYPVSVQGGRTYEMLLDIGTGRYVTITTSQAKSDVTVDGEYIGKSPIYNRYMNYGRHRSRLTERHLRGPGHHRRILQRQQGNQDGERGDAGHEQSLRRGNRQRGEQCRHLVQRPSGRYWHMEYPAPRGQLYH